MQLPGTVLKFFEFTRGRLTDRFGDRTGLELAAPMLSHQLLEENRLQGSTPVSIEL